MKRSKILALIITVLMVLSLAACSGGGSNEGSDEGSAAEFEARTIRVSTSTAETHPTYKALETFKSIVEEKTGGAVTVEIYANSVLGSEDSVITQIQSGALDAAVMGGISYFSEQAPIVAVEEVPFLFNDYEQAVAAYNGEFGSYLAEVALEPYDVHLVNYWINGFRHFTNNVRPIKEPADMQGIKFRSAPVDMRLLTFDTLGASAVSINFNELFTALQQGTVDGQENPLNVIYSQQFYEVQKYLSLSGHIYNPSPFIFSTKCWNDYPDELKAILEEAAAAAQEQQVNAIISDENTLVEQLQSEGMEVNEIDHEAFRAAVEPVWNNFKETYGEEGAKLLDLAS